MILGSSNWISIGNGRFAFGHSSESPSQAILLSPWDQTIIVELLDVEINTYEQHKEGLLGTSEGKFVLIHGWNVVDIYDSKWDEIRQGYKQFGNVPFLVKQVVEVETPQNYTSNLLAT